MTSLQIYRVRDSSNAPAIVTLNEGEHIIGRNTLKFNDVEDRIISRKHALITVCENSVTIKSLMVTPCFLISKTSDRKITTLSKDTTAQLLDGDIFSFNPDYEYWCKVKLSATDTVESSNKPNSNKRSSCDEETGETNKRIKLDVDIEPEDRENGQEVGAQNLQERETGKENLAELNSDDGQRSTPQEVEVKLDTTAPLNQQENDATKEKVSDNQAEDNEAEPTQPITAATSDTPIKTDIQDEPSSTTQAEGEEKTKASDANGASGSTSAPPKPSQRLPRERCWYAPNCYRKNPKHKLDFSHQGDEDFDSDPNDNRPICGYDPNCYRTNLLHRRQLRHSTKPCPKPNDGNQLPRKRRTKKVNYAAADSDEDDYDLEDPFIDDSEDEYEISSDESDLDFQDSQEAEEDTEEIREMVNEAKRYIKNRKN